MIGRLLPSAHVDTFTRDGLPPLEQWPAFNATGVFDYPATLNAASALLDSAVSDGFGDRTAIVSQNDSGGWKYTTYSELQKHTDAIANALVHGLGLVTGNRVLLRGFNGPMLAASWLAVLKAGGVAVTTMPMLRARELHTVLQQAQCSIALCDAKLSHELELAARNDSHLRHMCLWDCEGNSASTSLNTLMAKHTRPFEAVRTSSDDVCLVAFTSGTTGVPKGCMHFHRDVIAVCDAFSAGVLQPGPGDRFIGTPPLAFTFGLGALLVFPLHARASAVLLESASAETLLDAIEQTHATITATAPTFYRAMSLAIEREPKRWITASLKQSISAGEVLPASTRGLWRQATGIEMLDGIGATEMMHIFIASSGSNSREGAIGKAVRGYDVAILDQACQVVPLGTVGRLAVRGPTGCRYLSDTRQRTYVQHGWNFTGDAGTMDADGYVYFKSRTDDLIISSGYNIGAPEVEAAVLEHPSVAECAVIGVADASRGQCVKAFIVLKAGVDAGDELVREIQDHVKRIIAPYKYPRLVEFLAALPRTETGKLQRFRLRSDQT